MERFRTPSLRLSYQALVAIGPILIVLLLVVVGMFFYLLSENRADYTNTGVVESQLVAVPLRNGGFCSCESQLDQVCGSNGITYANTCEASCYGVSLLYPGVCAGSMGDSEHEDAGLASEVEDTLLADSHTLLPENTRLQAVILPPNGSYAPSSCIPGLDSYWVSDDGVTIAEYMEGELPIVFDFPHGGKILPETFIDRTQGTNLTGLDTNSREYGCEAAQELRRLTGKLPHIIINHIHRSKIDANRDIQEACYPHVTVYDSTNPCHRTWKTFHDLIDSASQAVVSNYGKGHVFDLHTWGQEIGVYIGTDLTRTDLDRTDASLNKNTYLVKSTQKNLASILGHTLAGVTRGAQSMGGFLAALGYPAYPSPVYPRQLPNGGIFPDGSYNVARHGSRQTGTVDASQIETHISFIADEPLVLTYGVNFGRSALNFIESQYEVSLSNGQPVPTPTPTPEPSITPTDTPVPTLTATPTPVSTPTPTLTPSSSTVFLDSFESGDLSNWSITGDVAVTQQSVFAGAYAMRTFMDGINPIQLTTREFGQTYPNVTSKMYLKFGPDFLLPTGGYLYFMQLQKTNPYVSILTQRLYYKNSRYYLSMTHVDDAGLIYITPGSMTGGKDITTLVTSGKWYLFETTFNAGTGTNGLGRLRVFDPSLSIQTPLFTLSRSTLDYSATHPDALRVGTSTGTATIRGNGTVYFDDVSVTSP